MRKSTPIAALAALFGLQLTALAYAQMLSADTTTPHMTIFITVLVVTVAIDIVSTRHLMRFLKRQEALYETEAATQLERSLEEYHAAAQAERQDTRALARTMEDELGSARAALATGDARDLDRHLQSSLAAASTAQTAPCENAIVAAVLASKARQCEGSGTAFHTQVYLPERLPLDETELASVFFNLVDHALLKGEGRTVLVRSHIQAGQLFVEASTPCKSGAPAHRETTVGTQIVADIARRHGGIAEFRKSDGNSVARVLLPLAQSGTR